MGDGEVLERFVAYFNTRYKLDHKEKYAKPFINCFAYCIDWHPEEVVGYLKSKGFKL